jgi:prepilin-type N-terminal cleavage/methylation domain-containing protein
MSTRRGLSLIEIVLGMAILATFAGPLAYLFISSNRSRVSARDMSVAMNLSNCYLSALKDLPRSSLGVLAPTLDSAVSSDFSPHHLEIPDSPERFTRELEIREIPVPEGLSKAYRMIVKVNWDRGSDRKKGEFILESILPSEPW